MDNKPKCEFCEYKDRNKFFGDFGIEATMRIIPPSHWEYRYRLSVAGERIVIKFCPKCGRSLND